MHANHVRDVVSLESVEQKATEVTRKKKRCEKETKKRNKQLTNFGMH